MKKRPVFEKPLRSRLAASATILALSSVGCAGNGDQELYTGMLQPIGGTCDPPAQASLQVQNNAVMFTPNLGTLILRGTVDPHGDIRAALTVLGAERKPYQLTFENVGATGANDQTIEGRYSTPRCAYRITLHKR